MKVLEEKMTNLEKYENAFIVTFGIEKNKIGELEYQSIQEWDSVGHMSLIAELEDVFDIMMDTDDIIDLGSFEQGKVILGKYCIKL